MLVNVSVPAVVLDADGEGLPGVGHLGPAGRQVGGVRAQPAQGLFDAAAGGSGLQGGGAGAGVGGDDARSVAAEGPRAERARLETPVGDEVAAGAVVGADVGRGRGGDRVAEGVWPPLPLVSAPARITGEEGRTWQASTPAYAELVFALPGFLNSGSVTTFAASEASVFTR